MKFILFVLLLAACNDSGIEQNNSPGSNQAAAPSAAKTGGENEGDCSSFFWFKKGTVATFNETGANGKNSGITTTTITDVQNEGDVTTARFTSDLSGSEKIEGRFKCEGHKVMMDLGSVFRDNTINGVRMELSNDGWIEFPLNAKTGDKLDGTPYEMKAVKDGKTFMIMKSEVDNRSVGDKEKITTPAGSWDGFAIKEIRTMTMDMPAVKGTMPVQKMQFAYWFVPGFGVVKTEVRDGNGKLQHRSELASLK